MRLRPHASKAQWDRLPMVQPCMRTSQDSPQLIKLRNSLKKNLFKRITKIRLQTWSINSKVGLRSPLRLTIPVLTRLYSKYPKVSLTPVPMPLNQAPSTNTHLTLWMDSQKPSASLRLQPATKTLFKPICNQYKLTISIRSQIWIRWVRESTLVARRFHLEMKTKVTTALWCNVWWSATRAQRT